MIKKIPVWLDGQYIAITTIYKSEDDLYDWCREMDFLDASGGHPGYDNQVKDFLDGFSYFTSQAFLMALRDELNVRIDKLETERLKHEN